MPCVGAYVNSEICSVWCHGLMNNTHPTRHTSQFFGNWQNRSCLFSPDLRLFKSNTARDECISANKHNTKGQPFSDCQWRRRMLFFFVELKNRVNLVLFFKPWFMSWEWSDCLCSQHRSKRVFSMIRINDQLSQEPARIMLFYSHRLKALLGSNTFLAKFAAL